MEMTIKIHLSSEQIKTAVARSDLIDDPFLLKFTVHSALFCSMHIHDGPGVSEKGFFLSRSPWFNLTIRSNLAVIWTKNVWSQAQCTMFCVLCTVCPYWDFALLPSCPEVVWRHSGEIQPLFLPSWLRTVWQTVIRRGKIPWNTLPQQEIEPVPWRRYIKWETFIFPLSCHDY